MDDVRANACSDKDLSAVLAEIGAGDRDGCATKAVALGGGRTRISAPTDSVEAGQGVREQVSRLGNEVVCVDRYGNVNTCASWLGKNLKYK